MRTEDLDYTLPEELIATEPPTERDGARLMVLRRSTNTVEHHTVLELPELLQPSTLLVVNDTRVIAARLRGTKPTGGRAEFLLVRAQSPDARHWTAMARASKPIRKDTVVTISDSFAVKALARREDGLTDIELIGDDPWRLIETFGEVPLPPYVHRAPRTEDKVRYQTIFAERPGAVAAPTAGLHLSQRLLSSLDARGIERAKVTLHVGPGTFAPVTTDDLDHHAMHSEWYEIPIETQRAVLTARRENRPVLAVGTTTVRALESWSATGLSVGDTKLLIQPGYRFCAVDQLLTNLHLPRSTLLALVMALAGVDLTRRAYSTAVTERYKFFSYGDATLVL